MSLAVAVLAAAPGLPFPLPAGVRLGAQEAIPGYTRAGAERQRAVEASAVARPDPATMERHVRALSAETHVAGTPAQERSRDYVLAELKRMGLATEARGYRVWLPHATGVQLWVYRPRPVASTAPAATLVRKDGGGSAVGGAPGSAGAGGAGGAGVDTVALALAEPPVAGDATSALPQYPTVNGGSAAGDATGEVVYVNYGLIEDYAQLDSMGVSVRGKIAVARYGRSFRGIKAREAEKRGAVALLIYSDPADDGYVRGDVYPEGPLRPAFGVQRGSVVNGQGDPSTPGWPSVDGARRLPLDSMRVPRIPVVPIGYGNAAVLLEGVRGAAVPQPWQGGLAFRYHAGPGPVRARVRVTTDAATGGGFKTVWNTFGTIRGSEQPDELVIVGAHRDGWGPGAGDNVSGTASVLEAARAVMEEARAGRPPKRTLVFATWDAEEWGLVGSSEYVEEDSLRLSRHLVAYLNQDVAASGPNFGGGGSPSLRAVLRDVTRGVPDPSGGGSVYAVWRARAGLPAAGVADSAEPAMGDPGGGSDFAGFYNHLGVPHADWGFGGVGGVYHSQYDSFDWMRRFGDPGFRYHAAAARVNAALLLRLANADVLPYDYVEFARTMRRYLPGVARSAAARRVAAPDVAPLAAAIDRMERSAAAFATTRDAALAAPTPPPPAALAAANTALKQVEKALTRPEGLRTRPWFRTLIYAADEDNGYANVVFPSVSEALRDGDAARAGAEVVDLAGRFDAATRALETATRALAGR